jgi:hypothetical protein
MKRNDIDILYQYLDFNNPLTKEYLELIELDLMDFAVNENSGELMFFLTPLGEEVAKTF